MEYREYNRDLAQRFVNDYRLPIPIINRTIFFNRLLDYEEEFHSWTLWCNTVDYVNDLFGGDVDKFLQDFYEVRDKIIKSVQESEAYQKFNHMDMNQFATDFSKYKPEGKGYYNEQNIGRKLISIDLRKANFQALNYVDKEILGNSQSYEDFVMKYTNNPYIIQSKYFRQVIFGQMNPGRHITVEKYMISKVLDNIEHSDECHRELNPNFERTKIVCINSDEVVIEDNHMTNPILFSSSMYKNYNIDVRVEPFELHGYNFYSNNENHHRFTFYVKNGVFMCVPGPYFALTYKLYHDEEPNDLDYHFNYENIDCVFNDTFSIEEIKK